MTPAEARVLTESLGLSPRWLAERLGLKSDRHLRAIDAGEAPVSVRYATLLHELESRHEAEVDGWLARIFEGLGIDEADDDYLEQLDEADWPTLIVPRLDDPADEFPASWYRALAGRVRWELNGFCWIEYEQP